MDIDRKVTGIQLSDGSILTVGEAINATAENHIKGLFIGIDRHGRRYLRLRQDGDADENQDSLSLI